MSCHYWGITLLSDHHAPLLFIVTHQVVRLEKPCPHTVSRTPEYHLGPVVLSPADAADFRASVLQRRDVDQRRDIDPQLALVRWLKCLQHAIYNWAKATDRVRTLNFRHYRLRLRPAERASPLQSPKVPFPARSMLPSPGQFTAMAQSMLGGCVTVGHTLKRNLVALGEAQR